jgi:tight adherence protein B
MYTTSILLFFLFLTYAAYLLATRKSEVRRERLQMRVADALRDAGGDPAAQQQQILLSRRETISGVPALSRLLGGLRLIGRLDRLVVQADLQITVTRLLVFCAAAGLMAALAAFTVTSSLLVVGALGLLAAAAPVSHVSWVRKRRLRKFLEHLPDALDLMSRSLAVGHAFSEALNQVATEMPDPVANEFRVAFEEQKLGLSLKVALQHLSERVPLLDLRFCITAMLIQRETGGNLAELLEKVAATMRERFKVLEEFRTLTTASRGSAWILCLMPVVIVLAMTAINPRHMSVLFNDPRGHYILAAAAVMQLVGVLSIRKILDIKF